MAEDLNRLLSRLAIAHRNAVAGAMTKIGLHSGQAGVLFSLWERDGLSQADLARELGVAAPTVNVLVSKLEEQGFVSVKPCPKDGRLKRVFITEKADGIRAEAEQEIRALEAKVLHGFSDLEKNAAFIVLERLSGNLDCQKES
jgi:DNA-binding MarR family transcriptional regulator